MAGARQDVGLSAAGGSARNIPSHRTVTSRSANPASYVPTAPLPPTSGPRHRGRTPGPGQTGDHPCPHAFPARDLTGGQQRDRPARDCAGSPRSVLPQPAGPVFTLGLPVLFLVIFALVFTGTAKVAGRSAPRSTTSPASSRWRSSAPHSAI